MTDQHIPCFRSRLPFDYNIKKNMYKKKELSKKSRIFLCIIF